jgi:hypothetical protein
MNLPKPLTEKHWYGFLVHRQKWVTQVDIIKFFSSAEMQQKIAAKNGAKKSSTSSRRDDETRTM